MWCANITVQKEYYEFLKLEKWKGYISPFLSDWVTVEFISFAIEFAAFAIEFIAFASSIAKT